jgi:hypothetical protein
MLLNDREDKNRIPNRAQRDAEMERWFWRGTGKFWFFGGLGVVVIVYNLIQKACGHG